MRRTVGALVLAAAGGFAVAVVVGLLVAAPYLVRLPTDVDEQSVATGQNVVVFSPSDRSLRTDVRARAVQTVEAAAPAGPDTAAFRSDSTVTATDGTLLAAGRYGFCVDRDTRTERAACTRDRAAEEPWTAFGGPVWTFPTGVPARDRTVHDPTLGTTATLRYTRDGRIGGLPVLRFEQQVDRTVVAHRDVPGELTGARPGTTVAADVTYAGKRIVWVEPVSGTVVSRAEQRTILVDRSDRTTLYPVFVGTLVLDRRSEADAVARASAAGTRITVVRTTLPVAFGAAGVLLLAAGAWLAVRPRPE